MTEHEAAVLLGTIGGNAKLKQYGPEAYSKMGTAGTATVKARYGRRDYFRLMRFGYKPSQMTQEQRELALRAIDADQVRRKHEKAISAQRKRGRPKS